MNISFATLVERLSVQNSTTLPTKGILAFDPGETTGWAYFLGSKLVSSGQINTKSIKNAYNEFTALIDDYTPELIIFEDYRIYSWKSTTHKWSNVYTARVIGCLLTVAVMFELDTVSRLAANPKGFVTDDKLKAWGMYIPGARHARDAIRHGAYHLLFGLSKNDAEINSQDTNNDHSLAKPLSK